MNKKVNKRINIVESICVLLGIACMILAMMFYRNNISSHYIFNILMFIVGITCEVVVVSIELFSFHLETIQYKLLTVIYYIVELILALWINANYPFAGLIVITVFSILKNIYRVVSVEKIYMPLGFYELCKKFGIKVKKPSTRKKKAVPVKKRVSVLPAQAKAKTKFKRNKAIDTSKSYA